MKTIVTGVILVCFFVFPVKAQEPLLVKTCGGYSTQWEVKLMDYGKDNNVMIFDILLTLKKGKDGEYGIGRGNKGTRVISSDGTEYNQTWVSVGSKKSAENTLTFAGTAAFVSSTFSVDVPLKVQLRFNGVESEDFSLLGFYVADNSNYGYTGGFLCEIKRTEFERK